MRIVTFQNIGDLGPSEGESVFYHWRWYYNAPTLPIWALILLLLVVPKDNRNRQAWLILLPLGLVWILWRMLTTLLALPASMTESFSGCIISWIMAWSIVWLAGHWLVGNNRKRTFFPVLGVMLAVGLLSYYGHFDNTDNLLMMAIPYSIFAVIIPMAMMLTSYFCRNTYTPRRFRLWLLAWGIAVTLGLILSYFVILMTYIHPELANIGMIISTLFESIKCGGILYLINLPFLELALRCPFYRERFEKIFLVGKDYRPEDESNRPSDDVPLPA